MASADADQDPIGENCSTPAKRNKAWTARMQRIVEAKDTIDEAAGFGVKELEDEV